MKIFYSSVNEDSQSEINAMKIASSDVVFCITGSGSRPLDLLTQNPQKIISVDMNATQNYLLELQIAAIKELSYEELLGFLGICECKNRDVLYRAVRPFLYKDAGSFWDKNIEMIQKGVIYQGNWERHFAKLSYVLRKWRPSLVKELFAITTIEEQEAFWKKCWKTSLWNLFLKSLASRFLFKTVLKDPGFYHYVPPDFSISKYLIDCLDRAAAQFLFRDSSFARLLFLGKIEVDLLPPYLKKENFEMMRANVSKIEIHTGAMHTYLQSLPHQVVDKFSLSDFSSYTSLWDYKDTWHQLERVAKPQALFFERQFLVKRDLPIEQQRHLCTEEGLIEEAANSDMSIFYTFKIYTKKTSLMTKGRNQSMNLLKNPGSKMHAM